MKSRFALIAATAAGLLAASYTVTLAAQATPPDIAAAIADASRPQAQKDVDALRKPAELMTFAGVKRGDKVVELVPGGGYVTRIISKIVGPTGKVYAVNLPTFNERFKAGLDPIKSDPGFANLVVLEQRYIDMTFPEPVDVVWTSENYHDFQNQGMFSTDTATMNKAVFAALKPGGVYIVTDYPGAAGTGKTQTQSLHRIDPAVIKQEVTAAGFVLEAESNALANPSDILTTRSGQPSTQVLYKFRKPR
ncbi:MAG: methyltransferase [Alphaproteobacteria bacterium]|nr:methyltransferase [Alphaproteobacteria bacterium]